MSTNTDTVLKLSEALTELIEAYEKLQNENDEITAKNKALEDELSNIKKDKASIESTVNELNENTEKQESNINSMLGKIESLLGVNKSTANKKELKDIVVQETEETQESKKDEAQEIEESIFNVPAQHEVKEEIKEETSLADINIKSSEKIDISVTKVEEKKEEDEDNKLDLNRMASLLNGFNK